MAKIDEHEDDIIFSTLGQHSKKKTVARQNYSEQDFIRNIEVAQYFQEQDGDQEDFMDDISEVPTPLKTNSSINESQRDKNVLSRAIGEFAQEHSTAKKKKEMRLG